MRMEECPFCGGAVDTAIDGKFYCKRCLICPFFTAEQWNDRYDLKRLRKRNLELVVLRWVLVLLGIWVLWMR